MESDPNPPQNPQRKSPLAALLIGFAPAALLMAAIAVATIAAATNTTVASRIAGVMLWLACFICVLCCYVSSRMLFGRRTATAVVGAVLLLLLNGFIALFFGCTASFNS